MVSMQVNGLSKIILTPILDGFQTLFQRPCRYIPEAYQGFHREDVGGRWVSKKG